MSTARKIAILSGSYREFDWYCRQNNLDRHKVIYISRAVHIEGILSDPPLLVIRIGKWRTRPDSEQIEQLCRACGYEVRDEEI